MKFTRRAWLYILALCPMLLMGNNANAMLGPFTRKLESRDPPMSGKDVVILQNLLKRFPRAKDLSITSEYDQQTSMAVKAFQDANHMEATGVLDDRTARVVLDQLLSDGFKDDRSAPAAHGYKFKLFVPVYKDRNKETNATLFNAEGKQIFSFRIRAHGWKDINQLTRNGNTPTGLMTFDLNSKEPNPKKFGPYPVLRCVKGLKGNAAIGDQRGTTLISDYRSGILLHTGQWRGWDPSMPMPNSLGCMHCHPDDQKKIVDILNKDLGIKVRKNPFGTLPYPYEPQGLIAIEQQD